MPDRSGDDQDMAHIATETRFEYDESGGWAILRPIGEIDAYWASRLRDHMGLLLDRSDLGLVVDLEAVGFLDSTGIGVLMGGLKRARASGGDVRLAAAQPFVTKVLEITGLHRIFSSYETVAEAVAAPR